MPPTAWTIQTAAAQPTNQAIDSANGNKFVNDGTIRVRFKGAAAATGTVLFAINQKCNYGINHNPASVSNALDATTKELEFGPFNQGIFNNPTTGEITVSYFGTVTGITANVIRDAPASFQGVGAEG